MLLKVMTMQDKYRCVDALTAGHTIRQVFFNSDQSFSRQIIFYLVKKRCVNGCDLENNERTNLPKDCLVGVSSYVQALMTREDFSSFMVHPNEFAEGNIKYFLKTLGDIHNFYDYLSNCDIPFFEILENPADINVIPSYPNSK